MNDLLRLTTPRVNDFRNPTFVRREADVRRRLDDLPLLNLAVSVPELARHVPMLAREPLGVAERLRLLELYRASVTGVVMAAENRRLRQMPISSNARQRLKEEILGLCYELANGYKVAVLELVARGRDPAVDVTFALAVRRALEQLRNALLHSYRIYRAIPPRHFLEMHQLYHFAEHRGAAAMALPSGKAQRNEGTIDRVYLQSMLLAIADPFRLVDGAIEDLFRFLGDQLEHCRLHRGVRGKPHDDALFLVRADTDLPPAIYGRAPLDRPGTAPYTIDATAMIGLLDGSPDRTGGKPAGESLANFAKWLLPRLRVTWERSQPRRQVEKTVRIAIGLDAICYLLSPAGRESLSRPPGGQFGIEVQELEDAEASAVTLESWTILNESLNGLMLKRPELPDREVQVGDLMLVVQDCGRNGNGHPVVSVVRWMGNRDESLQVGVELLPGNPASVGLAAETGDEALSGASALYLPSIKQLQIPATLLAPKGLYRPRRPLVIDTGTRQVRICCGELLMTTEFLERFRLGRPGG